MGVTKVQTNHKEALDHKARLRSKNWPMTEQMGRADAKPCTAPIPDQFFSAMAPLSATEQTVSRSASCQRRLSVLESGGDEA